MPRRSPRAIALWGAAVVVALVTATVVAGDLAALHRRAADLGPEVDAVVATRDLAVGRRLAARDLSTRSVHRSQLPAGVVADPGAAVGRIVAVPVLRGSYLVRLAVAPRRRTGLDGVVPPGMRAMRVVVTDALTPRAGAAVDVLATYDPSTSGEEGGTIVVAAGVTVLGTDRRGGAGAGRTGAAGVTLLVDPDQAAALADAQANGVVTVALVPPEDASTRSIGALSVLHAIILGIVQGLSEFLPISSSGHLIIVPELFGWTELTSNDSLNKTFDVALHVGTLIAVLAYFRHEVWSYVVAAWHSLRTRSITTTDERLAWLLLLTAIPGAIIGALFTSVIEDNLGDPILIGINMILFGLVLQWADGLAGARPTEEFHRRDAWLMGAAQALALAPGVSRSGATISMGRWLRFDRASAAKLSFLMSIPITGGAALYKGAEMFRDGGIPAGFGGAFFWGIIASMVSGFLAIAFLLRYVRTHSFLPFVIYRIVLGVAVIIIFATGIR